METRLPATPRRSPSAGGLESRQARLWSLQARRHHRHLPYLHPSAPEGRKVTLAQRDGAARTLNIGALARLPDPRSGFAIRPALTMSSAGSRWRQRREKRPAGSRPPAGAEQRSGCRRVIINTGPPCSTPFQRFLCPVLCEHGCVMGSRAKALVPCSAPCLLEDSECQTA